MGCRPPNFEAVTIDGQKLNSVDMRGKVVVLVFWAIYCKPCRPEIPTINKLAEEFKDKQVVIIGFPDDKKSAIENFLAKQAYNIPIVEKNHNIEDNYFSYGYPLNFIIDKKGIVHKVWHGGTIGADAEAKAYEKFKLAINECL